MTLIDNICYSSQCILLPRTCKKKRKRSWFYDVISSSKYIIIITGKHNTHSSMFTQVSTSIAHSHTVSFTCGFTPPSRKPCQLVNMVYARIVIHYIKKTQIINWEKSLVSLILILDEDWGKGIIEVVKCKNYSETKEFAKNRKKRRAASNQS